MSKYFRHYGDVNLLEVIEITNWKLISNGEEITFDDALESKICMLTNGKDNLALTMDEYGFIKSFWILNESSPNFLIELIGYCIGDEDFETGIVSDRYYVDDEDFINWLNKNTFFDN